MSSFRDQSWKSRFDQMGDMAEGVFERVYPQKWVRFGLNRPPLRMSMLPPKIRYSPDYLTSKGFVEVQGFGRDQTFKLKTDKWEALNDWHADFRTDLFVFDSTNNEYAWVRLTDLAEALDRADLRTFSEGKNYWAWIRNDLPVVNDEWTGVPEDATGQDIFLRSRQA